MRTTIKVRFRASTSMPDSGTPVIQITRCRKTSTVSSSFIVSSEEWNIDRNEVVIPENVSIKRKKELLKLRQSLRKDVRLFQETAEILDVQLGDYSAKELASYFKKRKLGQMFCEYANRKIEKLIADKRHETAHLLKYALLSFSDFLGNKDVRIDQVNIYLMKNYEEYLFRNKKSKNTVSAYMRSLRAVYNRSIRERIFMPKNPNDNPFAGVFIGNDKTAKRAIDVESISRLAELESDESKPAEKLRRDMFMFSFYTQGMPFIDLINLKKENIVGKYIHYKRQKTDQNITIELENCMRAIIEYYYDEDSKYIFPVLRGMENRLKSEQVEDAYLMWKKTRSALAIYNKQLKKLAVKAGIEERLTSYVARHSWATIASREGIPVSVISRGMGHESERTTQFYIARADYSDVGRANRKILEQLVM